MSSTPVFITWSGELSHSVAQHLRIWLPCVLQSTKPFLSSADTRKGRVWREELEQALKTAEHGIAVLTRTSITSDWLLYEAGAVSNALGSGSVWTVLVGDITPEDIRGPLSGFQHTRIDDKRDVKKLIADINNALGSQRLEPDVLELVFEEWWPKLDERVRTALSEHPEESLTGPRDAQEPDQALNEILGLVRAMSDSLLEQRSERLDDHSHLQISESLTERLFTSDILTQQPQSFIGDARTIDISGIHLLRTTHTLWPVFQARLRSGSRIRVLLLNPENECATSAAAFRFERHQDPERLKQEIRIALSNYESLAESVPEGALEIRVLDVMPPYGIWSMDAARRNGRMYVEAYSFRDDEVAFLLDPVRDARWYSFFIRQFESMWESAHAHMPAPAPS